MVKTNKRRPSPRNTRPSPRKPTRRVPRRPADSETERRILEAARRVLVRRGTHGARMQEIAAEAGVNQALLHYYFRSKERLAAAVFQMVAGRILPSLIDTLGSDLPLAEKVDRLVGLYLHNLSLNPFLAGYLISELHHHPQRAAQLLGAEPARVVPPAIETLRRQIDEAVAAGTMHRITPEQFVINFVSLCVFPFAAKPMLGVLLGLDDRSLPRFFEQRKTELPAFLKNALRA